MSIICSICGKKQSGFVQSFRLSDSLASYLICANCDDVRQRMINSAGKNIDRYNENKMYFDNILSSSNTPKEVAVFFQEFYDECAIKNNVIIEEKESQNRILEKEKSERRLYEQKKNEIILTSTNTLQGYIVEEYIDVISKQIVVGAGLYTEFFAGFTDVFGGRSVKVEERLKELVNMGRSELLDVAMEMGADAVLGYKADLEEISGKNTLMFMINVSGTAVKLKK